MPATDGKPRLRLGVSSCLLGNPVRYDGGHKLDRALRDTLGQFMEFVPVCPEVECGLPVPREAMRLVGNPAATRLVTRTGGRDLTDPMLSWARRRVRELEGERLCGFVFKSNSPSCGMAGVKVYTEQGRPSHSGSGLFARALMDHLPHLPVLDEEGFRDPSLRENFVEHTLRDAPLAGTARHRGRPRQSGDVPHPPQTAGDGPQPPALPGPGALGARGQLPA